MHDLVAAIHSSIYSFISLLMSFIPLSLFFSTPPKMATQTNQTSQTDENKSRALQLLNGLTQVTPMVTPMPTIAMGTAMRTAMPTPLPTTHLPTPMTSSKASKAPPTTQSNQSNQKVLLLLDILCLG
jgi:hypothetical protein